MIKIIHKGTVPKKYIQVRKVKCKTCGTVFIAQKEDFHWQMTGHGESDESIHCPVCCRELWLRGYDNEYEEMEIEEEEFLNMK